MGHKVSKDEFFAKLDQSKGPDSCWLWTGSVYHYGYGQTKRDGKGRGAHVVALELSSGEAAAGRQALHRCDVPLCCNPKHLFWGSPKDNVVDCIEKGRRANVTGERNPAAKFTQEDVATIRARYRPYCRKNSIHVMAREYGVWPDTIGHIVRKQKYV